MSSEGTVLDITARRVELKFSIDAAQSLAIAQWARENMQRDQNIADNANDTYQITSLYLDTPNFDIYHRNEDVSKRKHRVRRYGNDQRVWLETKRKSKDVVHKRRSMFAGGEIADLFSAEVLNALDAFQSMHSDIDEHCPLWFQRRVGHLQLRPASYVSYQRFARVASEAGHPFRLTIDSNISSAQAQQWTLPTQLDCLAPLTDQQILELKFVNTLPRAFEQLMGAFPFVINKFSKYRSSVSAFYEGPALGLVA